jgi:hypothetical protein
VKNSFRAAAVIPKTDPLFTCQCTLLPRPFEATAFIFYHIPFFLSTTFFTFRKIIADLLYKMRKTAQKLLYVGKSVKTPQSA